MLNVFNEGTSERTRRTCTKENSTLTWKTIERVEGTTNPAVGESGVVSSEKCMDTVGPQQIEGKPLVLLQANCRSILNKILEFWNLVDTYNPVVLIGTESWLSDEINNVEEFMDDYIIFRRDTNTRGGGVFICVKNYIDCRELWTDDDFEMIAVEVKGRDPKFTSEIVGIYRAPNEDSRVIERLAARTDYIGNSTKRSIIGGDLNLPFADWNGNAVGNSGTQALINNLVWENGYSQEVDSPTRGEA
jgi:hypothetical protein